MKKKEIFASRWGIIFAGLGMAVGTGNIWRFPRIVSQFGGGAFFIAWLFFLFFWSIPLLIVETTLGRKTRLGVVGTFGQIMGKNFTWMGTFVAFVPTAITFYYTVITGWCLKYFLASSFRGLIKRNSLQFWQSFTSSWEPVLFHFISIVLGCFIIYAGVVKGIEKANKILIPSLFILLIICCLRAVTLSEASQGLNFLFSPNLARLADYKIWLAALSQSAWSTGAGWGLMLTYAVYSRRGENPILISSTLGFGDYVASLLAAVTVIPTVFSYFSSQGFSHDKVMDVMKVNDQGLTFIWIPNLFSKIPAGSFFLSLFFLALCLAAFSSLVSLLELITRVLIDAGISRKKAVTIVAISCFAMGLPSAFSMGFFSNQDWVWGMGLLVNGLFFALAVIKFGPRNFRKEIISTSEWKMNLGKVFDVLVKFFLPFQALAMLFWWFWTSYSGDPQGWMNIFSQLSVGTVLFQWITALIIFILLNKIINRKMITNGSESKL